jgi:predicted ribosome quality control (RQC) complex YloA/Tae2 family protein
MAFDGIVTMAIAKELQEKITFGKIEKIYQPESDELVFNIYTKGGNVKLYVSVNSATSRVHLITSSPANPPAPLAFCMLLRKHLQGARITDVSQKDSERIIEISLETLDDLGFRVSKKLIFEIMGKHSNVILLDISKGKIIDSIKRVSIDVNRVRQLLPGIVYQYPPAQDKIPFKELTEADMANIPLDAKSIQRSIAGISPALAEEIAQHQNPYEFITHLTSNIEHGNIQPVVYCDEHNVPREFHVTPLREYEHTCSSINFPSLSEAMEYYYDNKQTSNRANQKSSDLIRTISAQLDKLKLKAQRLSEDLLKAENSDDLRLFGELLTANMHSIKAGADKVTLTNYYDNSQITIPLDPRYSPAKNAQNYFKKYGKSKTAIKEKQVQIQANEEEIKYLDSVLSYLENAENVAEIDAIRKELEDTGYIRKRKIPGGFKEKSYKADPIKYTLSSGATVLVGKNNKENDVLTFKTASSKDIWFHTKDIPGSHVILQTGGLEPNDEDIFEVASIAAYYSKGRNSENVPVDYVQVKYVKKPAGAKPGMVIFTNNKTVWVNPKLPD